MRSHQVLVDRPVEKGGADEGPMGGELFLAAVGGCFMTICWLRPEPGRLRYPMSVPRFAV